jgi:hypothetical protein
MADLTDRMLDSWNPGTTVDVHFEFSSLTSASPRGSRSGAAANVA